MNGQEEKTNAGVLSALSDAYDREYYVDAASVDYPLLERSGYRLLHRPNICMYGSTRKMYTLNPHTKCGVDAAKIGNTAISFQDYLKLFEEEDKQQNRNT